MFNRIISKKVRTKRGNCRYLQPENVTLINLLNNNLKEYAEGKIVISHRKSHDCIILLYYFDGFCHAHVRLLSNKIFYT